MNEHEMARQVADVLIRVWSRSDGERYIPLSELAAELSNFDLAELSYILRWRPIELRAAGASAGCRFDIDHRDPEIQGPFGEPIGVHVRAAPELLDKAHL